MLLLIGTEDSKLKNGSIINEKCPKCKAENELHFSIYRRYVQITLIPLFPVGKTVFIECHHCKENFDYEDLSEGAQLQLRNEKLDKSLWMYAGSVILTLFLVFILYNYFNQKDTTRVLIKTPKQGDVYNLKLSNGYYSNMRIDKTTKDSIYATLNDFEVYMPYDVDDLDKVENYSDRQVSYSKKEIEKLFQENEITKITRKEVNFD